MHTNSRTCKVLCATLKLLQPVYTLPIVAELLDNINAICLCGADFLSKIIGSLLESGSLVDQEQMLILLTEIARTMHGEPRKMLVQLLSVASCADVNFAF